MSVTKRTKGDYTIQPQANAAIGTRANTIVETHTLIVDGNLVVTGDYLAEIEANLVVKDSVLTILGGSPGIPNTQDKGIAFDWWDVVGTKKRGFFGFRDATETWIFKPDTTFDGDSYEGELGLIESNIAGYVFLSNGTAYRPSLSFVSSNSSGIFYPASHTIGFSINETETARLSANLYQIFGNSSTSLTSIANEFRSNLGLVLQTAPTTGVFLTNGNLVSVKTNNANVISFVGQASGAVNYLLTNNAATTEPLSIEASGSDSDIDLIIAAKGAGNVIIKPALTVGNISTGSVHNENWDINSVAIIDSNKNLTTSASITFDGTSLVVAGNITGNGLTITSGNIWSDGSINIFGANVTGLANAVSDTDAVSKQYLESYFTVATANINAITQEDSSVVVTDTGSGNIVTTIDGLTVKYQTANGSVQSTPATVGLVQISSNFIQAVGESGNINMFLVPKGTGNIRVLNSNLIVDNTLRVSNEIYEMGSRVLTRATSFSGTGDITLTGTVNSGFAVMMNVVNANVGTFGNTDYYPVITVTDKGVITAVSTRSAGLEIAADYGNLVAVPTTTFILSGGFGVNTHVEGNTLTIDNTGVHTVSGGTGILANVNTGNIRITSNASLQDVTSIGNHTTLPVTIGNTLTVTGNIVLGGSLSQITAGNANLGNFRIIDNTISSIFGDINLQPADGEVLNIVSTSAMKIPTGTTAQRPYTEESVGQLRFNTDLGFLEYFNGISWVNAFNEISTETITPDGLANTFALSSYVTTEGALVSINGTIQVPGNAYTIVGNTITFTQTPTIVDIIEIRKLTATYNPIISGDVVSDNGNVALLITPTIADSFSANSYRSAKYLASVTNTSLGYYQTSEITLVHNGSATTDSVFGTVYTGNLLVNFSSNISGGNVNLLANGVTTGNTIKLQKTYIAV